MVCSGIASEELRHSHRCASLLNALVDSGGLQDLRA